MDFQNSAEADFPCRTHRTPCGSPRQLQKSTQQLRSTSVRAACTGQGEPKIIRCPFFEDDPDMLIPASIPENNAQKTALSILTSVPVSKSGRINRKKKRSKTTGGQQQAVAPLQENSRKKSHAQTDASWEQNTESSLKTSCPLPDGTTRMEGHGGEQRRAC